jgi:hypothetical protein
MMDTARIILVYLIHSQDSRLDKYYFKGVDVRVGEDDYNTLAHPLFSLNVCIMA